MKECAGERGFSRRHRLVAGLLGCAMPLALGSSAGAADLFAEQLDADNVRRLQVGGAHAIAGIDDWVLGNGVLCAAITKLGRPGRFTLRGGALVDLGHCGRANDQFVVMHPMLNLDRGSSPPFSKLDAHADEREARIRVSGEADGLRYERSYVLDRDEPRRLRVETTVTRVGAGARITSWGELTMHPGGSLRPFSVSLGAPLASSGFAHPGSEGESVRSRLSGIAQADLHVLVGEDSLEPAIAYGVHVATRVREHPGSEAEALPSFAIASEHFGMSTVLVRQPFFGAGGPVGLLQLAQSFLMNLRADETLRLATHVYVSDRADVASITDLLYRDAPLVRGRVDDPQARIHVLSSDGGPVTQTRPDRDGAFAFRVPAGRYTLRTLAPGERQLETPLEVPASSAAATTEMGLLRVGAPARVRLPQAGAMRLVFTGLNGAADPAFGDDLLGLSVGLLVPASALIANSVSLAGAPGDPSSVTLAPGRYRVIATRGPEYEITETEIEARAGQTATLRIDALERAIETPGWIAADLHVHSAASFDSGLPARERVRSFAAQGGEVLVATEHDRVFDIGPAIRALGLGDEMASVVGVESTSVLHSEAAPHTFGHANVFPMPHRPELFRGGAPTSQGVRLRAMMAEVRALPGERLVQLNHPRSRREGQWDGSFFTHLSTAGRPFEPARPLGAEPNRALLERDPHSGLRDLDFDALELLNGASQIGLDYYKRVRADWFSMLLQGEIRTGTANSDSHRLSTPVGVPRTYVPQADDRPGAFDPAAFTAALRQGRVFGTTGPFLEVDLDGAGMGARFSGRRATLTVRSRAPAWAAADRARAYVNGRLISERRLDAQGTARWALDFEGDAFVTVEIEGPPSDAFSALLPGSLPFAFSNPIYVDADADGRWTPPGLPSRPLITLTAPLAAP